MHVFLITHSHTYHSHMMLTAHIHFEATYGAFFLLKDLLTDLDERTLTIDSVSILGDMCSALTTPPDPPPSFFLFRKNYIKSERATVTNTRILAQHQVHFNPKHSNLDLQQLRYKGANQWSGEALGALEVFI